MRVTASLESHGHRRNVVATDPVEEPGNVVVSFQSRTDYLFHVLAAPDSRDLFYPPCLAPCFAFAWLASAPSNTPCSSRSTGMRRPIVLLLLGLSLFTANGFMVPEPAAACRATRPRWLATPTSSSDLHHRMGELNEPEQKVFALMKELHDSKYRFRIVVVGYGAILETTSVLGPVTKILQSASTGTNLLTLASEDQSFEFHLQLSQVSKMVLTTKETPKKTLQIVRLLNPEGVSMCSLILADQSEAAIDWYQKLQDDFGTEVQL